MKVHIHLSSEFPEALTLEEAQHLRNTLMAAVVSVGGRVTDVRTTPGQPEAWEQYTLPDLHRTDL